MFDKNRRSFSHNNYVCLCFGGICDGAFVTLKNMQLLPRIVLCIAIQVSPLKLMYTMYHVVGSWTSSSTARTKGNATTSWGRQCYSLPNQKPSLLSVGSVSADQVWWAIQQGHFPHAGAETSWLQQWWHSSKIFCSVLNKMDEVHNRILKNDFHIIAITEIWAREEITDGELNVDGYVLYRKDRKSDAVNSENDSKFQVSIWCQTETDRSQESLANAKVNARQHCVSLSCLCNSLTQTEWVV